MACQNFGTSFQRRAACATVALALLLAGCSGDRRAAPSDPARPAQAAEPERRAKTAPPVRTSKVETPRRAKPAESSPPAPARESDRPSRSNATNSSPYVEIGGASWYGKSLAGRKTASGERFDPEALTAAHRTLPLGSVVRVTNVHNGRSVVVRINDRGPFIAGRVLDCSEAAARELGFRAKGLTKVSIDWPEDASPPAPQRRKGH